MKLTNSIILAASYLVKNSLAQEVVPNFANGTIPVSSLVTTESSIPIDTPSSESFSLIESPSLSTQSFLPTQSMNSTEIPSIVPSSVPNNGNGSNIATEMTSITTVVTEFTTYCPEPTTIITNDATYVVTEATTLTITDCPCTLTTTGFVSNENTSNGIAVQTTSSSPNSPISNITNTAGGTTKVTSETTVVTEFTTYCPEPTTIITNDATYVVTEATTLTITDCPCTLVHDVTVTTSGSSGNAGSTTLEESSVTGSHSSVSSSSSTHSVATSDSGSNNIFVPTVFGIFGSVFLLFL